MPTAQTTIASAFAPFAEGRTVYLPVDRACRKYRDVGAEEFMFMHEDAEGYWLKHRATRNYLLVRCDGTPAVIVGQPGEAFFGGFYGEAPLSEVAWEAKRSKQKARASKGAKIRRQIMRDMGITGRE